MVYIAIMYRCPLCGSNDVKRDKYGGETNLYSFYCKKCKTNQQKQDNEPDFKTWYARWTVPEPAR